MKTKLTKILSWLPLVVVLLWAAMALFWRPSPPEALRADFTVWPDFGTNPVFEEVGIKADTERPSVTPVEIVFIHDEEDQTLYYTNVIHFNIFESRFYR